MNFFELNSAGKDEEALKAYLIFVEENFICDANNKKMLPFERLKWLVDNRYYINFFDLYTEEEIKNFINYTYNQKLEFKSFMSAFLFYNDYSLKSNDKKIFYETYQDRLISISLYLANGNIKKAYDFSKVMVNQWYQPATPTFLNSGKKSRGELVSCFLLDVDDSLNSINYNFNMASQLSKIGGGVALNLSKLRAKGESIKGIANATKGVIPVMKILEDLFSYVDQMGQRKGAGAVYLNIFHRDVLDFLDTKKINSDEKSRIQTLSLGLIIPNKFIDLVKQNATLNLFYPFSVYQNYGKHLDDMNMDEMYDELSNNPKVLKYQLNAREMLLKISEIQFESGYPYLMFRDNANEQNPLKGINTIKMSNICTEIYQIQESSLISDDNEADVLGYDISCVLGSLNIVNVMEANSLKESVFAGTEILTSVSDLTSIKNAKTIRKANDMFHSIGLGVMNLHGFFMKNNIPFESDEAKEFCDIFFMAMNYYSLVKSNQIAKEREQSFYGFDKSDYKNGKYFTHYINTPYVAKLDQIKTLLKDFYIPTQQDWVDLSHSISKFGLYNSYRLAIAPTAKIAYLQNATSSVMPITDHYENRIYGNYNITYPAPFLTKENQLFYKTAYNTDMKKLIDLISIIQKHIDQGISTTLYIKSDYSTRDLQKLYIYAHSKGLKSLYYTRTKNLTLEECESCVI